MALTFGQVKDFFELLSYIAFSLGIPAALFEYARENRHDRQEREQEIYDSLDEGFIEFQKLCLQYPYLDIADIPDERPIQLTPAQQKEEYTALLVLFSLFERAYLMQQESPMPATQAQWYGWDKAIHQYFQRANVVRAWQNVGQWFDPRFEEYISAVLAEESVERQPPMREGRTPRTG
jgi:hypothetical protein